MDCRGVGNEVWLCQMLAMVTNVFYIVRLERAGNGVRHAFYSINEQGNPLALASLDLTHDHHLCR